LFLIIYNFLCLIFESIESVSKKRATKNPKTNKLGQLLSIAFESPYIEGGTTPKIKFNVFISYHF